MVKAGQWAKTSSLAVNLPGACLLNFGLGPEGPFLGLTYFSEQQLVIQRLIIMLIDRHEKFYENSCPTLTSPSESSDSPYPL